MDSTRIITGEFATRFFVAGLLVFGASAGLAAMLAAGFPPATRDANLPLRAFAVTTLLLAVASGLLHRAVQFVRLERQHAFRRCLFLALICGALFLAIQCYGLMCLIAAHRPVDAQTGAPAFVFVFAAMHGLHVSVALLFLLFVTLRAIADRYDHEYYWGVVVTAWFWHALGIVWVAILIVIVVAT